MGNCSYNVTALQENGITGLNATSLEPWPIINLGAGGIGAFAGFFEDEYLVFVNQTIRFQCIDANDFIFDLDTAQPVMREEDGSLTNYIDHTCLESEETGEPILGGNYVCYNAPTSTPTVSASPSQTPSRQPTGLPSVVPTLSNAPSTTPEPSSSPSSNPSLAPSTVGMSNRIAIDELRDNVQSLSLSQTDVLNAIAALTQRLDRMESMIQTNGQQISNLRANTANLRDYTEFKIMDTQYWVRRCWYYNTRSDINFNDNNIFT